MRAIPDRATGLILGLVVATIYLLTLSNDPSADSLLFALDLESGSLNRLVDPTHIALHPLGLAFYRLWQAAGWEGGAWRPSQVLNALCGALTVILFYPSARRLARSAAIARTAALGFAFSGAIWLLSVEAEYVTPALAATLAVLGAVLRLDKKTIASDRYTDSLLLAAGTFLAALLYASSLLTLIPFVAAGYLLIPGASPAARLRRLLVYLATLLLLFLPLVFLLAGSAGHVARFLGELLDPAGYGGWRPLDVAHGGYAFLRSLGLYPGLVMNDGTALFLASARTTERVIFAVYYAMLALIALLPPGFLLRRRKEATPEERRALYLLLFWSALYALFAVYWVPGDISFWVQVLAAWWLMVALSLGVAQPLAPLVRAGRPALPFLVLTLLLVNAALVIIPRHSRALSPAFQVVEQLDRLAAPGDLIALNGNELLGLQIAYLTDFPLVPLFPRHGHAQEAHEVLAEALGAAAAADQDLYLVDSCRLQCSAWRELLAVALPPDLLPIWQSSPARIYRLPRQ